MNDSKLTSEYCAGSRSERGLGGVLKMGFLLGLLSIAASGAQAQSAAPAADDSLTWHGLTLYGIRHGLDHYGDTVRMFADRVVDARSLVAEVVPVNDAARAFELLEGGRSGAPKVILDLGVDW